jgi:phospholipid/cholesterol/gamma-HCH transport system substrate-binding protein
MTQLQKFADQGTPLFTDLNAEGKDLSRATLKLTPFANRAIPALTTLGDAAETAGPKIAASDPVLADLASLGSKTGPASNDLASLLDTFTKTQGLQYLTDFIFNTVGNVNGYDADGHYQRGTLQVSACQDYQAAIFSGCEAFFQRPTTAPAPAKKKKKKAKKTRAGLQRAARPGAKSTLPGGGTLQQADAYLGFLLGGGS